MDNIKTVSNVSLIDDELNKIMKLARIAVENGEMTKDEISKFIAEKGNEYFIGIFEASDDEFAFMLLDDIMESLPSILKRYKGDDSDEV